ncbi:Bax inhibitor-1/YccA family protein [Maricaulis sp.]|uniref:Bax inhibitor-1/YccA family protein n=1 Tax=Maricaulis sp. TaxID=1486257 RepID=UPI0025C26966|nr:Bax inhibitor-1/YccA family protein [Maricaulis sp.]
MNDFSRTYSGAGSLDMSVDAGLRSFMLGVYNKMGLGLLLSAAIAYAVGTYPPLTNLVFGTPLLFAVQWGPLALLIGSSFFMRNPSPIGSAVLYWAIVTLIGASLSFWVIIASSGQVVQSVGGRSLSVDFGTIAQAFVITAGAFMALSVFGYTTKRNLMPMQSFLFMAVFGAVALGVLNFIFFQSGMLELLLQFAVLLLMAGVVAWQTQSLKVTYYQIAGDQRSMAVMTNMGALNLYIAFVNMFQIILSLFGSRE